VYLLVRVVICLAQSVRIETCQTMSRVLAVLANDILRVRRQVVNDNLASIFPELSAIERIDLARRMWEHLFLMGCEIFHAPRKIHRTNYQRYVRIERRREIVRYLLDPRPILLVSGHFGNFEMGGFITGLLGFHTYTVARPLDNPFLDDYINRFRSFNGQHMLSKQGSSNQIEQILASGETLSLLGDQHAGPKGCWVDFFGRPASCHKAIALFTLKSGAPLLLGYCRRDGKPMRFEQSVVGTVDPRDAGEEFDGVKPLTQWYNRMLEKAVRVAPEQYWWLHRRWKGTPPTRKSRSNKVAA
jgi:KDO2-lipid IV(A) lauroyltransferase